MRTLQILGCTLLFCGFLIGLSFATAAESDFIEYEIDQSAVPTINDRSLTYNIYIGDSRSVELTDGDGPIPFAWDSSSRTIHFTTDRDRFKLTFSGHSDTTDIGQIEIANLRENKRWAYSHSFDDNYHLEAQIEIMNRYNYPGTLYLIGENVGETDLGEWEIDGWRAIELLESGWSLGNHTWDHEAYCSDYETEEERRQSLIWTQNRLEGFIRQSNRPDYRIIAFATPCSGDLGPAYSALIDEFKADQTLPLLFNESVYAEGIDVSSPFDFTAPVPRDGRIDGRDSVAEVIIATFDNMSEQAGTPAEIPYWYNTFSHGSDLFGDNSATFAEVMAYLDATYGANGSREVWVAPADQIYSYLLLRDLSTVQIIDSSLSNPSTTPTEIPTEIPAETPAVTPTTTATLIPTTMPSDTATPIPSATSTPSPTATAVGNRPNLPHIRYLPFISTVE